MVRHYFLGGNTPLGFFSYYDSLIRQEQAKKIYIIKGGPGTGKSTFMKKVGKWACEFGYNTDYLHCSSDPDSLDGLIINDINVALVDGTSPHIVDPKTPGAVDCIINLGDFWNEYGIKSNKDKIIECNNKIKEYFSEAYKYLKASKAMFDGTTEIYKSSIDELSAIETAMSIAKTEIQKSPDLRRKGFDRKLFATAFTPKGVINFIDTLSRNYKIYLIKSEWGMGGNIFMNTISNYARMSCCDIETFYSPMEPENYIEHIVIKDLKLAFITESKYNQININSYKTIDMNTFIDHSKIALFSTELEYNLINIDSLINMAVYCISKAKNEHDMLEECYIPHMNFNAINDACEKIFEDIKSL